MALMKNLGPVLNKADMYARIINGEFGNTLPRWFSWDKWWFDPMGAKSKPLWGIQSTTIAGDPRARLDYPRDQVFDYLLESGLHKDGYCISPMVHQYGTVLWEGDVFQDVDGLTCLGHAKPEKGSWRRHMQKPNVWKRSAALVLLKTVLSDYSARDVLKLIEDYPDHVVEFSALDTDYGTVPGRNAVIWEVRRY